MTEMKDRVAIVTGGVKGIGLACVKRLLAAGALGVVIADIDEDRGQSCLKELGEESVMYQKTDVGNLQHCQSLVQATLDRWGRVDVLVNSAGSVGEKGPMTSHSPEALDQIWKVNVLGTYFTCQACHPHMKEQGYGRIVNIASIAGKEGNPGLVPYSMTKAAVIGFTKAFSKEVAEEGILVNSVAPAVIQTEILDGVSDEVISYMVSKIPMGRVGQPEEVAELVLFLASEQLSFSTGFCYDISGGRATY